MAQRIIFNPSDPGFRPEPLPDERPPVNPTETTEVCWEDADGSISQASVSITQLREDGQTTGYPARQADGGFCLDFRPETLRKEPILGETVVGGARPTPLSLAAA